LTASISWVIAGHSWVNSAVMPTTALSSGTRAAISSNVSPTR
jgi:hypothetical protein